MPDINSVFTLIFRIFFLLGSVFYVIFAVVVVRQVAMMSKNVYDKFNTILIIFSYLHLAFSIFLVLLTFILTI
ncbi:MAG: hypothetical protein BWY41_01553 [Candidatus Atribacteria bacterium ADurb.Bin276]|uniref:Uncharacterized protein n=1 Tax=Candidatus Atribacter allofermentans TaxID=1852833 RepID=A0A1V5SNL9_9BACT|nr:MAG: hypothetical protein BWY41_01553 [Candidatus Atribacteria bacterium ADurb.Bin276]